MHPKWARGATPAPRFAILIGMESSGPSMTYQQSDAIRDHVFPLFDLPAEEAGPAKPRFMGTGFFVGRRGYALTAAHVMRGASRAAAGMAGPDGWLGFAILSCEEHPREDVAVLSVAPPAPATPWSSFFTLHARDTRGSLPYDLWGYPEDAYIELMASGGDGRPDLVYSAGHVRRRVRDVPIPNIRGTDLIELSSVAGGGCSGSPVLRRIEGQRWDLLGVYLGERLDERSTSVGYAARLDDLGDWAPAVLGRSLTDEINDTDPRWL